MLFCLARVENGLLTSVYPQVDTHFEALSGISNDSDFAAESSPYHLWTYQTQVTDSLGVSPATYVTDLCENPCLYPEEMQHILQLYAWEFANKARES
jgi:hypothetical protein